MRSFCRGVPARRGHAHAQQEPLTHPQAATAGRCCQSGPATACQHACRGPCTRWQLLAGVSLEPVQAAVVGPCSGGPIAGACGGLCLRPARVKKPRCHGRGVPCTPHRAPCVLCTPHGAPCVLCTPHGAPCVLCTPQAFYARPRRSMHAPYVLCTPHRAICRCCSSAVWKPQKHMLPVQRLLAARLLKVRGKKRTFCKGAAFSGAFSTVPLEPSLLIPLKLLLKAVGPCDKQEPWTHTS